MNVAVAGTGYVGLVSAAVFAQMGHNVVGLDIDEAKVASLNDGRAPFFEAGLDDLLERNKERLSFTSCYRDAYHNAEIIFIAVPTPERMDGSAELKYVYTAVEQIAESLSSDSVVVVKSTVPLGTNSHVQSRFDALLSDSPFSVEVVSNPEFLSQGTAVNDMLHPDRVVVGVRSESAKNTMERFYASVDAPVLFMSLESAEMVKYASNDFLALKISYINEIANLCELLGADISDVAYGMGKDPRIGSRFLKAGIGYGGSCFPKDTKALHWLSSYHDRELKTVKAAIEVNAQQKIVLIKKAKRHCESFEGKTVAVLGLSFKPGTDDLREAPSIQNIAILLDDGAKVKAWDPLAEGRYKKLYPEHDIEYCGTIEEALAQSDACFIMTEWPEVCSLKPDDFKRLMSDPIVFDGRNCFDVSSMRDAGIVYESIGR